MTISTDDNREEYAGNDSATNFAVNFLFFQNSDLQVTLVDADGVPSTLTEGSDYSITGANDPTGGEVTYPLSGDPLAIGESLIILRIVELTQETDLRNQGTYYPETLEAELDRSRMIDQQQQDELNRSLKKNVGEDDFDAMMSGIKNMTTPNAPQSEDAANVEYVQNYVQNVAQGLVGAVPDIYYLQGDGSTTSFSVPGIELVNEGVYWVTVDGLEQQPQSYTVDIGAQTITFGEAPPVPFDPEENNIVVRNLGFKRTINNADTTFVSTSTGTETIPAALDGRVIRVSSRTAMKAIDAAVDQQFSLEEGGRSGKFVRRSGTPPVSDPNEGIYVVADAGGYDERVEKEDYYAEWFGESVGALLAAVTFIGADPKTLIVSTVQEVADGTTLSVPVNVITRVLPGAGITREAGGVSATEFSTEGAFESYSSNITTDITLSVDGAFVYHGDFDDLTKANLSVSNDGKGPVTRKGLTLGGNVRLLSGAAQNTSLVPQDTDFPVTALLWMEDLEGTQMLGQINAHAPSGVADAVTNIFKTAWYTTAPDGSTRKRFDMESRQNPAVATWAQLSRFIIANNGDAPRLQVGVPQPLVDNVNNKFDTSNVSGYPHSGLFRGDTGEVLALENLTAVVDEDVNLLFSHADSNGDEQRTAEIKTVIRNNNPATIIGSLRLRAKKPDGSFADSVTCHRDAVFINGTEDSGAGNGSLVVLSEDDVEKSSPTILATNSSGAASFIIYNGDGAGGWNAADTVMRVGLNSGTSRSINAAGTINASGADYAEYMEKDGDFTLEKGDICGVTSEGKLTNKFSKALSFLIKSTKPSYVGNDVYAAHLVEPQEPKLKHAPYSGPKMPEGKPAEPEPQPNNEADLNLMDEYKEAMKKWKAEMKAFKKAAKDHNEKIEKEKEEFNRTVYADYEKELEAYEDEKERLRFYVDRIAFAGQVPVNAQASPGQYIVPVAGSNDSIDSEATASPTFEQYMAAVGKVVKVQDDGRPVVIVKVA